MKRYADLVDWSIRIDITPPPLWLGTRISPTDPLRYNIENSSQNPFTSEIRVLWDHISSLTLDLK